MEIFDWITSAGGNNFAPPDGFPEGMNYSQVNNAAREIMAVLARWYADTNGSLTTAGTGNAYTLSANQVVSSYTNGLTYRFRADRANTGPVTLNVDSVGAADVVGLSGAPLEANDWRTNGIYTVTYNSTTMKWVWGFQGASETQRGIVEIASASEVTAGTATDKVVSPANFAAGVNASVNQSTVASAWVRFATPSTTIAGQLNVSGVTRTAVGRYTVNFTTPLSNANYAAVATAGQSGATFMVCRMDNTGFATGSCKVVIENGAGAFDDPESVSVVVFGGA